MRLRSSGNGTPSLAGDGDAQRTWQSQDNSLSLCWRAERLLNEHPKVGHAALVVAQDVPVERPGLSQERVDAVHSTLWLILISMRPARLDRNHVEKRQKDNKQSLKTSKEPRRYTPLQPSAGSGGD